jgi:hypothetical protein
VWRQTQYDATDNNNNGSSTLSHYTEPIRRYTYSLRLHT